jgi:hypothetical protein
LADLSQHERQALAKMQSAEGHCDPDLLAAFSEQALTSREREKVLAHLATCPTCREVVALSAPVRVEAEQVVTGRKPALWRWPVLRWGAVAASALTIVVVVSMNQLKTNGPAANYSMAGSPAQPVTPSNVPAEADQAKEQAPVATSAPASAGLKPPKIRYEKVSPQLANESAKLSKDDNDAFRSKELDMSAGKSGQTAAAGAQAVNDAASEENLPPRTADERSGYGNMVETRPAPVAPTSESANTESKLAANSVPSKESEIQVTAGTLDGRTAEMHDSLSKQKTQVAQKKPAPAAAQASIGETMTYTTVPQDMKLARTRALQWQVTDKGYLQRSFDSGQTWQQASPNAGFRAVAFIGNHVWAGANNGVLMHSGDNGQSWARVTPQANNVSLQGDITGIKFIDLKNGTVTTSAGETWTTTDGGKNWGRE